MSPPAPFRVVVVGAGFAGAATTVQLLRAWRGGPLQLTLLEPEAEAGPGVAFSTPDERHLLNVVAGGMSALPEAPGHFLDWLHARDPAATAGSFAPRTAYGAYLRDLLASTVAEAPEGAVFERLVDEAVDVVEGESGAAWSVVTAGGTTLPADAVVLAVGVNRPRTPSGVAPELVGHPGWIGDPWDQARLAALGDAETVAIIGSGLTMIDVAISLADGAGAPGLLALSRRGVLPRAHRSTPPQRLTTFQPPLGPLTADRLAAHVESAALAEIAAGGDWRSAVDGVRPYTQTLWQALPLGEQARFLARHARRWEIHRHRMAPGIAERVADLRASGRLELRAGSLQRVAPVAGAGGAIELVYRGEEGVTRVEVDAVVNCTGPDPAPTADPLLNSLIAAGKARAGTLGLGLDTALDGELRDCDGNPPRPLHARRAAARPAVGVDRGARDPRPGGRARHPARRSWRRALCAARRCLSDGAPPGADVTSSAVPAPADPRSSLGRAAVAVWAVAAAALLVLLALWQRNGYWEYSDGVYALTARLVADGHGLYDEVAAAQPPPIYLVAAGVLSVSDGLTALRASLAAVELATSALVLVAVWRLTRVRAAAVIAALLVLVTPWALREHAQLLPETFAAPLLLAAALAAGRSRCRTRRRAGGGGDGVQARVRAAGAGDPAGRRRARWTGAGVGGVRGDRCGAGAGLSGALWRRRRRGSGDGAAGERDRRALVRRRTVGAGRLEPAAAARLRGARLAAAGADRRRRAAARARRRRARRAAAVPDALQDRQLPDDRRRRRAAAAVPRRGRRRRRAAPEGATRRRAS